MINVENLSFKYRGSKRDVLKHLSLSLSENQICGLLGKNGVGKSTLLYLISGLLKPDMGSVKVDGMLSIKRSPEFLKDVFLCPEEFFLPNTTMSEYVKITAPFYPRFSEIVLNECLKEFELPENIKLNELSMGQKKKAFMSFAIATGTRYLLMDEPTNGLDIPSKAQFRRVISRNMTDERTIIISTHQVHDVEAVLDHVVIMSENGILLNKSTEDICREYVFEERTVDDMADALYAEPSPRGNIVMAKRGTRPETQINLEVLFNAVTSIKEGVR